MALGRVDDHAGLFVDDHDRIILVQNVEGDVLRDWPLAGHFELNYRDEIAREQLQRWFAGGAVDENLAGVDGSLERSAAKGRQPLGEEYVEALAGLFGRNRE
jgi:hypothetical protein